MEPHHRAAIARWSDHARDQPGHLALIVAGSLTKGYGRPDSDVDGLIVVTDEEMARRRSTGELTFFSADLCGYPGGYVDAKYVDHAFLEAVAARGSEPARSAFIGALVPWSEIDGLPTLIERIVAYPEVDREEKIGRFFAQLSAAQWYVREAEKHDDPYLASWAATRLVLFGCRLVLAHNRVLFPYHKWLMRTVGELADRPDDLLDLATALLASPTPENADAFATSIVFFTEWPAASTAWSAQFVLDSEWNWLEHPPPVEDL